MQPTEVQVQASLQALRTPLAEPTTVGEASADAPEGVDVPDLVQQRLDEEPAVRAERLEEARRRLDAGEQPTADDLAQRIVGRFVCDRLR